MALFFRALLLISQVQLKPIINISRVISMSCMPIAKKLKKTVFSQSTTNLDSFWYVTVPGGGSVFPLPGTFPWANSSRGKPRRGMMRRAVFSDLQRKGLEKRFQIQKYISKPDRKKLAEKLGLKDSQVSPNGSFFYFIRPNSPISKVT